MRKHGEKLVLAAIRVAQHHLVGLALGDVIDDPCQPVDPVTRIADRKGALGDPASVTVGTNDPVLDLDEITRRDVIPPL